MVVDLLWFPFAGAGKLCRADKEMNWRMALNINACHCKKKKEK